MWTNGTFHIEDSTVSFWVKHFEEGSRFGIDGGRISKLQLQLSGNDVCLYERGWGLMPTCKIAEIALDSLLKKYN